MAKFYSNRGIGTSVAEAWDREPGADQRVDRRYQFTDGFDRLSTPGSRNSLSFQGPSEQDVSKKLRAMKRRSAVTAASRYQWSQGGSAGKEFGRRQAAAVDRRINPEDEISDVETIAKF